MNIDSAFPSSWLKASDVEQDMTLTIKGVTLEKVGQGDDQEYKPVVYFLESNKGLVLNKVNAGVISTLYGHETDDWQGKRITLFQAQVDFRGKPTLAIRVRLKPPTPLAEKDGNGTARLWERWNSLSAEALKLKVPVPMLDPAAEPPDIIAAGKKLAADIEAAKNF